MSGGMHGAAGVVASSKANDVNCIPTISGHVGQAMDYKECGVRRHGGARAAVACLSCAIHADTAVPHRRRWGGRPTARSPTPGSWGCSVFIFPAREFDTALSRRCRWGRRWTTRSPTSGGMALCGSSRPACCGCSCQVGKQKESKGYEQSKQELSFMWHGASWTPSPGSLRMFLPGRKETN